MKLFRCGTGSSRMGSAEVPRMDRACVTSAGAVARLAESPMMAADDPDAVPMRRHPVVQSAAWAQLRYAVIRPRSTRSTRSDGSRGKEGG